MNSKIIQINCDFEASGRYFAGFWVSWYVSVKYGNVIAVRVERESRYTYRFHSELNFWDTREPCFYAGLWWNMLNNAGLGLIQPDLKELSKSMYNQRETQWERDDERIVAVWIERESRYIYIHTMEFNLEILGKPVSMRDYVGLFRIKRVLGSLVSLS